MAFVCLAARNALRAALDIGSGAELERMGGEHGDSDSRDDVRLLPKDMFLVADVDFTFDVVGMAIAVALGSTGTDTEVTVEIGVFRGFVL